MPAQYPSRVNPNHVTPPIIPDVAEDQLPKAIAGARLALDNHKAVRPPSTDILALTAWAQEKSHLETALNMLLTQSKVGWTEVPVPAGLPDQPSAEPVAPPSIPNPVSRKETPMPNTPKPPAEQLQHQVDHLKFQMEKVGNAKNRTDFIRMRQAAYWMRGEIMKFSRKHQLVVPHLPDVPKDPFAERTQSQPKSAPNLTTTMAEPLDPTLAPKLMVKVEASPELQDHLAQFLAEARALLPPWVRPVMEELVRARAKFPSVDHLTLALAEESGEVVKAVLDLREGKGTKAELHSEIIQTIAMCVRLLEEGDPTVLGKDVA
jgi:hypothetical protein